MLIGRRFTHQGFSMIEILVSLCLMSFVAVNITGLQRQLWQQQRHNMSHVMILNIATEKMEWLLSVVNQQDIMALNQQQQIIQDATLGEVDLLWQVHDSQLTGVENQDLKQVTLQLSWQTRENKKGDLVVHDALSDETQTYRCSMYLFVAMKQSEQTAQAG